MVKSGKGGLGRGLNSLLGGSYEEVGNLEAQTNRINVPNDFPSKEKPIVKFKESFTDKEEQLDNEESINDEEGLITIKSVLSRDTGEVPIGSVSPNPDQPRTSFNKEELEELAHSIEKDGLLQPILVRTLNPYSYQIIAGERRWQACKLAGLKTIPIRIKDANDEEALELALIENIQRTALNPIEEAYGYRRMMERGNLTQSEVAQAMCKGRSTVANALRLLELPEEAQQLLFEEKITAGHARAILSIQSKEGRQKLTKKMLTEKISVREAESIARLFSHRPEKPGSQRTVIPQSYKLAARALREGLHTSVKVKTVKGKNKIEIEFRDEEELKRLLKDLLGSED